MKKVKKGNFGYLNYEKKKRFLVTLAMFAIPLLIYVTGYVQTKTRQNLFTFVAILGCLPACKSLIGFIMAALQKPAKPEVYEAAKAAAGDLTAGYDLVFTAYEHSTPVNALIVCGNQVVCYTPDEKTDPAYLEKHITKILSANGYTSEQVKVLKDLPKYLQRVEQIRKKQDHYREDIPFTPDEKHPEATREELIYGVLLAICL